MITIALAEAQEIMRKGLAALLEREEDLQIVGECATGRELLELVERCHPQVVILEIALPELNGFEAAYRIRQTSPQTRLIVLSNCVDELHVQRMLDIGVVGYIAKNGRVRELLEAIRHAAQGALHLGSAVIGMALTSKERTINRLSPREREVLQLIAEGKSSKEIARALHISLETVKTHRKRIMEKLEIHDASSLTRYAIQHGITHLTLLFGIMLKN